MSRWDIMRELTIGLKWKKKKIPTTSAEFDQTTHLSVGRRVSEGVAVAAAAAVNLGGSEFSFFSLSLLLALCGRWTTRAPAVADMASRVQLTRHENSGKQGVTCPSAVWKWRQFEISRLLNAPGGLDDVDLWDVSIVWQPPVRLTGTNFIHLKYLKNKCNVCWETLDK